MRGVFLSVSMVVLAACGGGGGGGSSTSGFSQTYTASAAQGELISYSVDTTKLTYSYTVIKANMVVKFQPATAILVAAV